MGTGVVLCEVVVFNLAGSGGGLLVRPEQVDDPAPTFLAVEVVEWRYVIT